MEIKELCYFFSLLRFIQFAKNSTIMESSVPLKLFSMKFANDILIHLLEKD